jgi:hypothetical protein
MEMGEINEGLSGGDKGRDLNELRERVLSRSGRGVGREWSSD